MKSLDQPICAISHVLMTYITHLMKTTHELRMFNICVIYEKSNICYTCASVYMRFNTRLTYDMDLTFNVLNHHARFTYVTHMFDLNRCETYMTHFAVYIILSSKILFYL